MSYQVFARKYRPRTFSDVLGQDHVVRTLCNAIEQKRLAHAYLFVGPRGTGKTSTARIFAKALNCTGGPRVDFDPDEDVCVEIAEGRSLDVLEIDGASNRGIDNIRDLRENVQFAPARGQYRIIYIDEVHMLTKESFNALLKTLEEPPSHVMFIFATTEPHKILPTILSRCQRFDLRPIPDDIIANHLVAIAAKEGVTLEPDAAYSIARVAEGGMRDAQSMLDQLVSFCGNHIVGQNVNDIFGVTSRETVARALTYILDRQLPSLLHLVHELAEAGRDMGQLLSEIMSAVRELLISKVAPQEAAAGSLPEPWRSKLGELLARTPADKIVRLMEVLSSAEEQMRWSTNKRLHLEMGLIRAVHSLAEANISDIIRALNGAPLPETPIATTLLPEPSRDLPPTPASAAAVAAPAPAVAAPAPAVAAPAPAFASARVAAAPSASEPSVSESAPTASLFPSAAPPAERSVLVDAPMPAGLEPIDDAEPLFDQGPSLFGDMPEADFAPPPAAETPMTPELWERVLTEARNRSRFKAGAIGHTLFISEEDRQLIIAVHPEDTDSRDALLSEDVQELLCDIAEPLCGHRFGIRVEKDDTIPLPEPEPEPEPTPEPTPEPKAKAAPKKSSEPSTPPPPPSLRPSEEEFYHDPLIEKALDEFHARLIKN